MAEEGCRQREACAGATTPPECGSLPPSTRHPHTNAQILPWQPRSARQKNLAVRARNKPRCPIVWLCCRHTASGYCRSSRFFLHERACECCRKWLRARFRPRAPRILPRRTLPPSAAQSELGYGLHSQTRCWCQEQWSESVFFVSCRASTSGQSRPCSADSAVILVRAPLYQAYITLVHGMITRNGALMLLLRGFAGVDSRTRARPPEAPCSLP